MTGGPCTAPRWQLQVGADPASPGGRSPPGSGVELPGPRCPAPPPDQPNGPRGGGAAVSSRSLLPAPAPVATRAASGRTRVARCVPPAGRAGQGPAGPRSGLGAAGSEEGLGGWSGPRQAGPGGRARRWLMRESPRAFRTLEVSGRARIPRSIGSGVSPRLVRRLGAGSCSRRCPISTRRTLTAPGLLLPHPGVFQK